MAILPVAMGSDLLRNRDFRLVAGSVGLSAWATGSRSWRSACRSRRRPTPDLPWPDSGSVSSVLRLRSPGTPGCWSTGSRPRAARRVSVLAPSSPRRSAYRRDGAILVLTALLGPRLRRLPAGRVRTGAAARGRGRIQEANGTSRRPLHRLRPRPRPRRSSVFGGGLGLAMGSMRSHSWRLPSRGWPFAFGVAPATSRTRAHPARTRRDLIPAPRPCAETGDDRRIQLAPVHVGGLGR